MTQRDDYLIDAILCHKDLAEQGQALALAEDGIRIALKIAGVKNVDNMDQFERASALLNVAQELAALTTVRVSVGWANGRGYNGKVYNGFPPEYDMFEADEEIYPDCPTDKELQQGDRGQAEIRLGEMI